MIGAGVPVCPRCAKRVYYAEEVIANGKHWHKSCFTCANPECKRRLDSRNAADKEGEAYCAHCYSKLFGPKGYGYGVGAGTLSMDGAVNTGYSSPPPFAQAQVAPLLENGVSNGHTSPDAPRSPLSSSDGSEGHVSAYTRLGVDMGFPARTTRTFGGAIKTQLGGTDSCHRCGKPVYMAERMMAAGSAWHKMTCFTCGQCSKKLESTTLCERDGEIYCKTCYGKNFGPKGYGYGLGAGTLQMQQ